jgi:hypothetical protein
MRGESPEEQQAREAMAALNALRDAAMLNLRAAGIAVDRLADIGAVAHRKGDAQIVALAHQGCLDVIATIAEASPIPVARGEAGDEGMGDQ